MNALFYLSFNQDVKLKYPDGFALWYFCSESLFFFLFLLALMPGVKTKLDKRLIYMQIGFLCVRGLIYALQDSGIYRTQNRERLMIILAYQLIFIAIVCFSAWRHGFYRKPKHE